ncbi:hypothetical protein CCR75_004675 [Bremia lactucae]|uniref:Uncharacterized protein n=1 Tax=Bremia lactucae TaxID=4779 RepID=A0A976IGI2_BRELC|nr:hypothetical protein CCR75_004672 [Bremia lactucae]TDH71072.1 hypothetical protein CCR75_004675 [Bremia lactucae]
MESHVEITMLKLRGNEEGSVNGKRGALSLFEELEACEFCSLEVQLKICEYDFTVLRVLGRGGFEMGNDCIKQTSASLYAMKKHAEKLCLAERRFWQCPEDLYLVLDLRRVGLSFCLPDFEKFKSQILLGVETSTKKKTSIDTDNDGSARYTRVLGAGDAASRAKALHIRDPALRLEAKRAGEIKQMRFFSSIDSAHMA